MSIHRQMIILNIFVSVLLKETSEVGFHIE